MWQSRSFQSASSSTKSSHPQYWKFLVSFPLLAESGLLIGCPNLSQVLTWYNQHHHGHSKNSFGWQSISLWSLPAAGTVKCECRRCISLHFIALHCGRHSEMWMHQMHCIGSSNVPLTLLNSAFTLLSTHSLKAQLSLEVSFTLLMFSSHCPGQTLPSIS